MKNKYGNYVILKILSTSEVEEKKAIAQSLLKNAYSVNVPKYKNRWIQFLEENPMKIPGLNAQTVKPSLFKPSGGYPDSATMHTSHSEANSPRTADGWGQEPRKRVSNDFRDEKSHFYHEKNKGYNGHKYDNMNQGWDDGAEDYSRGQDRNNQQNWFEAKNYKSGMGGHQGVNSATSANKKPTKNYGNQKFYEKNQHYTSKGGYNNFY